jgi:hypothetical protein
MMLLEPGRLMKFIRDCAVVHMGSGGLCLNVQRGQFIIVLRCDEHHCKFLSPHGIIVDKNDYIQNSTIICP